jgi:glycosyltransferase involved in cell wall biosynthesis
LKKIFSIIIPAYNCAEILIKTLNSIIIQNYKLYECIIVDGKSTDETLDIIKGFKKKYPNNIKFISEPDAGVYDAMNKGIKLAVGDYLYFIGAGDLLYPNILSEVCKYLKFDLEIVYGNVYMCHQNRFDGFERSKEEVLYSLICHQSMFYYKDIFVKHGFYDLRYNVYADNVLNYKIFGDDSICKTYLDLHIAKYLGGGFSERNYDSNYEKDYVENVIEAYGYEFLYGIYEKMIKSNHKSRKLIGWCTSTGYEQVKHKVKLEYLIDSNKKKWNTYLDNYKIYSPEDFLRDSEVQRPFILVFSHTYYKEISDWLNSNGFIKYKDYSYYSLLFLNLLNEIRDNTKY